MQAYVKIFVERCRICQRPKGRSHNTGLYRPWDSISMDFVLGLPKTYKDNVSIFVVVDRFSKLEHFIYCTNTSDATNIANMFFKEVVRLHGLPRSIIFDRDTRFVGHFLRNLWRKLGTNLKFSSAYHPRTNGQTKVVKEDYVIS